MTPETGRTFDFVSPLFSATSFSTCTGKIPLLWLRNLLRSFNFSLRRTFCGLSSVTSLTLSAAFVVDAVMFFKIVFAGGGLEAGNCGLFGNLTIGLTKDTASDVSTGFIGKPAVSPSTPLFDGELKGSLGLCCLFGNVAIGLTKDTASDVCSGGGGATFTSSTSVSGGDVRGKDETAVFLRGGLGVGSGSGSEGGSGGGSGGGGAFGNLGIWRSGKLEI